MGAEAIPVQAFAHFRADEISWLLPVVVPVAVRKGEALFRAGDTADGVFFLEKGRLAVLQRTGFDDRTQVVALLEPGASVGEGGATGLGQRTVTIIAIEDSQLYLLKRESLDALGEKQPQVLLTLLKRLLFISNLRLQKCSERLAHVL
jgi:CRP/FNR family cyclic AMP-dependent transcriptional regulator